jgi:hypothetical protein
MLMKRQHPRLATEGVVDQDAHHLDHHVNLIATGGLAASVRPLVYRKAVIVGMLGICGRTFERLVSAGKFPPPDAYAGKAPLWRPETLERWLDQGGARL